uniref:Family with sequence similarity 193 member A n=1 Tax=Varanus komodoensis TaxID=61221 RepID=A0A8D2L8H4_VARKO
ENPLLEKNYNHSIAVISLIDISNLLGILVGIAHDSYSEDTYRILLQQYCKLEQEMGQVAEAWLECQKRLDDYVDEQVAMKTKQHLLKEDWEVFKQRHFIEELNGKKAISGENNFTETMRHLLSSRLSISDCPNCNYRRRCTCDDCSLSHILMCGIMDSPVTDDLQSNHLPLQMDSAPDYFSEIHVPSMSSGSSGSTSTSPFTVQQIDRPRLIVTDNNSGPPFVIENEDVTPVSEKLGELYSTHHYDNADIVGNVNGIHKQFNGVVKNVTLKFESPQGSSSSSNSSEADAEEADEENGSSLAGIQAGDLLLGRNMIRKDEAERDGPLASYSALQANLGPACCECHACSQEAPGSSSPGPEVRSLPAGHQYGIPEKPAHPALHLYPHIHGQRPAHAVPHVPPPLLHPSLYTASPFAQNKALVQNHANDQHILSTSFQDYLYPSGFGSPADQKSSKFLSIWGSEVMHEKDRNGSTFLQDTFPGEGMPLSELGPNVLPVTSRNEEMTITDSKKQENTSKKKCLYHFQDAFMDPHKVVMATSSATSSVSCTATTVQSSSNQFKVSSKRSSSTGDMFHNISSKDHRCPMSAASQRNSTSVAPLSTLSSVMLSSPSAAHLPSPNAPSFSRVISTAPCFVDPHPGLCPTTVTSPAAKEDVLSAPSSVCSDPDCEGSSLCDQQNGDGEDSQDEGSCSGHSSCTSASTGQKEGKYCDCCYCEFFGHGGPPAAPTSRNYAEMREKLRLRLTKRKEGQPRKPELSSDKENVVDHRKVEDLLQFINSPEAKPVSSTRTAKRARHRQKRLKEKAHLEADAREQETHPLLEQPCPKEEAAQQPRESRAVKKKKKERGSTSCQTAQVHSQECQAMREPFPGAPGSIQKELLDKREASPDSTAKRASHGEPGPASDGFCEQPSPADGKDSKGLFKPEKPHEPLSLLLNIMHHQTEDKNKQQITQISKLFAQQLKKPSKMTYIQPNIKNKMQSKPQVTELQSFAVSRKEEKKLTAHKTKQLNSVTKSPFRRGSFFPSEELHNALFLQDCPQTKGKSKKSKKKKSGKGNSSIGKPSYRKLILLILCAFADDVFLPKDVDLDNVEMDATEREVEYFKRFCLDSARQTRQRLSINWSNFSLKKTTLAAQ